MAKSIELEVITPSKLFYKGQVELVIVRTLDGDEGFMADHAWACTLLDAGELWIQEAGSKDFKIAALAKGFADVKEKIVIFTDAAEWPSDINPERSKEERRKAEEWLTAPSKDDHEVELAKLAIAKAIVRMNVSEGGARRKR
ncbi:MAG: ATP synthase F1 subunit epsilon, partial [Eubacteriales bacterium]|nr:ATP synthase F1 subunit epsilon [Eubacteriales bacterium]MDD3350400.1 ATP synthase F1 subunit epsilon [Eubacteriales bacterium]